MFVSLGFLCALLLGFIVAPAYWARAVRLTTERLRQSLPLTELEIRAERDRLRAENAIRVHQLSAKIERSRLSDARQRVEINRRDATIGELERKVERIETELEASDNARRVLEATITDRVPKVEARLLEARQLLVQRDQEIKALQADTSKTFRALDDSLQVNAQQRSELDRLKASMAGRGLHARNGSSPGGESEVALRSEVESLRGRVRDQASLISRLQETLRAGGMQENADAAGRRELARQLSDDLEEAATALKGAQTGGGAQAQANAVEVETLKRKIEEQAGEIGKLTAALQAYEEEAAGRSQSLSLRDTKAALRARLNASEKETESLRENVSRLRKELVSANERIARQASHYMDELRRLGSGGGQRGTTQPPALPEAASAPAQPQAQVRNGSDGAPLEAQDVVTNAGNAPAVGEASPSGEPALEAAVSDAPPQRRKLMDRIASLAKS